MSVDENVLAPGRHVAEFKHIFEHFTTPMTDNKDKKKDDRDKQDDSQKPTSKLHSKDKAASEKALSKKQKKLLNRMKVFDLKMKVKRPDLVEAWDITSRDPLFLMTLKMVRNSVPVPRHWS